MKYDMDLPTLGRASLLFFFFTRFLFSFPFYFYYFFSLFKEQRLGGELYFAPIENKIFSLLPRAKENRDVRIFFFLTLFFFALWIFTSGTSHEERN